MTTLANDLISNLPIAFANAAGDPVPVPSGGDAPLASLDNAAVGLVAIGADGASVDFTPTQPPSTSDQTVAIAALFTRDDGTVITVTGSYDVPAAAVDTVAVSGNFNDSGITTRPL